MKRTVIGFIIGAILTVFAAGIMAYGKTAAEKIGVLYNDIKIVIDGEEYTPADAGGNTVEPFIHDGTTYLPVRAVANAFEKEVMWDDDTHTVVITTPETAEQSTEEPKTEE